MRYYGLALLFTLYSVTACGQWSEVWDDLEDYVDGVTTNPPVYVESILIQELREALLERMHVASEAGTVRNTNFYTGAATINDIDNEIEDIARYFMLTNNFNADAVFTNRNFDTSTAEVVSERLDACPPPSTVQTLVTNTVTRRDRGLTDGLRPAASFAAHMDVLNVGETWPYKFNSSLTSYYVNFNEGLNVRKTPLYEIIYTITNAYTNAQGVYNYQTGWIKKDHVSLQRFFVPTNDWTGAAGWVRAEINLNSTNNYNTATQNLPSVSFSVTGNAYAENWYHYEDRFYQNQAGLLHLTADTNTLTITGEHLQQINAGLPWANIFNMTPTAGLTSQTSTNLNDFTHLGDSITLYWVNTNLPARPIVLDINKGFGAAPAYKSVTSFVSRKRYLSALRATYKLTRGYAVVKKSWTTFAGGHDDTSFTAIKNALATETPTSSTSSFDTTTARKRYYVRYRCPSGAEGDDPYFIANAYSHAARVGVTNLTTNITFSIDLYATDDSPEVYYAGYVHSLWTEYDNELSGQSRTNCWKIATYDNITTGHGAWTFGNNDLPNDVQTEPQANAGHITHPQSSQDATTFRGYRTHIEEAILRWNFAYQ